MFLKAILPSVIKGLDEKLEPLGRAVRVNIDQVLGVALLVLLLVIGFWLYMRRSAGKGPKEPLKHVEASDDLMHP